MIDWLAEMNEGLIPSINSDSMLTWFQFAFLELMNCFQIDCRHQSEINELMKANESTSQHESVRIDWRQLINSFNFIKSNK